MVTVINPLLSLDEENALRRIFDYLEDEVKDYSALVPEERLGHIYHSVLVLRANTTIFEPLFDLGKTYSTPGAIAAMQTAGQQPAQFLSRHTAGNWGDVSFEDWEENQLSLRKGFRILSSYQTTVSEIVWVITEADRSSTTILLPEEY